MKLAVTEKWLRKQLAKGEEPTGLLACSPKLLQELRKVFGAVDARLPGTPGKLSS